ncbi:TonB-dependent receptor [Niastella caeni]|uniref:TonB-dependent receptor n=1 Tax=Niastella caeni TaxID=2569763 RepID=A0A4S8H8J3_9BACT|nr:TonB-dependent receptor [Niastella caeni]THU31190.1 TonB-dependent receptor [Niastella caeni]
MIGKPSSLKCLMAFFLLLNCTYLIAQERVVTGKIKDPSGNPLPGVNVNVWGTRISVTADVTGTFRLPVPSENSVLVFSFVGFLQKEQRVGTDSTFNISMAYDNADLDQVVVVGYGTSKRRDLTGSVYSVKPGMVTATPTFNALEALQGRIPGMDIQRSSGTAGAGVNVQIRGIRTINGTDKGQTGAPSAPLYIIDGFQGGSISDLNPNDIESVEVLKDASATAIYGWMGANGVVIVTTKKGKERPRISYNGFYGVNGYTQYPKGRTGEDYVALRREAWRTTNGTNPVSDDLLFSDAAELNAFKNNQWVDWYDLVNRNGVQQSHTASIQSGGDKTKVFFSTGYYKEEGMLRGNDFTRFNTRLNYDQRISNSFKAGFLTQVTYTNTNSRYDPLTQINSVGPLGQVYDSLGNIKLYPQQTAALASTKISPLADERPGVYKDNNIRGNINANGYFEFIPIAGLSIRTNLATTLSFNRRGYYYDSLSIRRRLSGLPNYAEQETGFSRFYAWENVVNYTRKIEDHSITLTGITSYTRSDDDALEAFGTRLLLPSNQFYRLDATEQISRSISSTLIRTTTMSYAGRINYSYKGKYLLTASLRADGVSRLAPGQKWDYFPSAAVGWNIHQEEFMKDVIFVNNFKIRASYGVAGNATVLPYATQNLIDPFSYGQGFGDISAYQYRFALTTGTADLGWEKTATRNLGIDFAFLKSRVFGTIDAYHSTTTDVLLRRSLPLSTGIENIWQNVGETENKGIEAAISVVPVSTRDLRWTSTVTYTAAKEKITKLIDGKDIFGNPIESKTLLLGRPVNSYYGYKKEGIWQTDEAAKAATIFVGSTPFRPGDIKLTDMDGNDTINTKDYTYLGSNVPKWFAGWQNTVTYKGFELSVYMFARWGQMIEAKFMGRYNPSGLGNGPANFNYWTPENPSNDFPRPRKDAAISSYTGYTALNFIDGSYLKVKTVTLGYTLPVAATRKVYLEKLRIYATANNIFTQAKNKLLKDYDPERGGDENGPLSRQIVIGINADF